MVKEETLWFLVRGVKFGFVPELHNYAREGYEQIWVVVARERQEGHPVFGVLGLWCVCFRLQMVCTSDGNE